jgi:hypothetical protein
MSPTECLAPYYRLGATALALAVPGLCTALLCGEYAIIGFAGVIATAIGVLLLLVAVFRYVLDPLEAAARSRSQPTQFTIADFLILVFWLQVPIAVVHAVVPKEAEVWIVLDCIAWMICISAWAISVRILSRAGIKVPRHRALFLAVVLPYAYAGTFSLVISGCLLVAALLNRGFREGLPFHVAWLVCASFVVALGLQLAAVFVRRMVASV